MSKQAGPPKLAQHSCEDKSQQIRFQYRRERRAQRAAVRVKLVGVGALHGTCSRHYNLQSSQTYLLKFGSAFKTTQEPHESNLVSTISSLLCTFLVRAQ